MGMYLPSLRDLFDIEPKSNIVGNNKYSTKIALINDFGSKIGITEEYVNHCYRYRLRESKKVPGVWISCEKAVELSKKEAKRQIENGKRLLKILAF